MKRIIYIFSVLAAIGGFLITSCSKDFVETKFYQEEQAQPLTTVEQLSAFVNGTYVKMRATAYLGRECRAIAEIHSDEVYTTGGSNYFLAESTYSLISTSRTPYDIWRAIYQTVGNANIVISTPDELTWGETSDQTKITAEVKRLKGQAYAIRALAFFDALRIFGQKYSGGTLGIVLPLKYDPNAIQARATIEETETQIEKDFNMALSLLGNTSDVSNKTQLSSWAVKALMTRFYLYKHDDAKVAELAKNIVDSGKYSVVNKDDVLTTFTKENTSNSVFELAVGTTESYGAESYGNLYSGYANLFALKGASDLYEANDIRKGFIKENDEGRLTLDTKFSDETGVHNVKIIRYEEVLLNGAEAMVTSDNATALRYYNLIRENRGLTKANSVTLDDIKKERIRELIGEGLRFWDLLRWGSPIPYYNTEGLLDTKLNKTIPDNMLAFPIPQTELNTPGGKVVQNPGY